MRGAQDACVFPEIHYVGFPFSISETFQQRNVNSSIAESVERVKEIKQLCDDSGKDLMIYISMGFGNPYGDPWSADVAAGWVEKLVQMGIRHVSLAVERELKSDPLLHTVLDHMSLISARIGGGGAIRIADGFYDWLCKSNPRAGDVRWRVQDGKLRIDVDSITIRGARNVTDLAREMGWAVPERELVIATSRILSHFKQDLELKGLLARLKDVPVEREDDEDGTESSISMRILTVDGADKVVWVVRNTYPDFPGQAPEITVMFRDEY